MFCGAPNMAATAFAGTPLTMKAMPGPEPMPISIEPEVRSCCSLASPADADSSMSRPCLAKMPVCMPMSSGVNDQANGTTLATRSFSAAFAEVSDAASKSTARPLRPDVTRAPKNRLIVSSRRFRSTLNSGKMIADIAAHCHAAGCAVAIEANRDALGQLSKFNELRAGLGFIVYLAAGHGLAGAILGAAGIGRARRYGAGSLHHGKRAVLRRLRHRDRGRQRLAVAVPGPLIGDARIDA